MQKNTENYMMFAKNDEDSKELPKWKKAQEDSKVKIILKRFIDNKEVVSKEELTKIWEKSPKTIQRSIKDGMPLHDISNSRFQVFNLEDVTRWRDGNIDKTMSIKTSLINQEQKSSIDTETNDTVEITKTDLERKLKADADESEIKVELARIKLAEAEGRVVDANDLDKAMSELAVLHKTDKIHDENILPILLENKDAGEIKKLLQEHNIERLEMLSKIVNKEYKSINTLYGIVEAALQELNSGVEPDSIIKRIQGSLI